MFDKYDRKSFQYDADAKSFQMTGFRWIDAPILFFSLLLTFCLMTGINLFAAVGLAFLNREVLLVLLGLTLGYLAGVCIGSMRSQVRRLPSPMFDDRKDVSLSERVKLIADDPHRKLDAIKAHLEETGISLGEAKRAVEEYINCDTSRNV